MTAWEAILLGIVQGAFMFMPVSSTSHLVVVQHWLIARGSALPPPDSPEMILFDLVVHVGTLVSVVVVFRSSLGKFVHRLALDLMARLPSRGPTPPSARSAEAPVEPPTHVGTPPTHVGIEEPVEGVLLRTEAGGGEGPVSTRSERGAVRTAPTPLISFPDVSPDAPQVPGALHLRLALLGLLTVGVTGALGLSLKTTFELIFAHPIAVAGTLTVTGLLLWTTDILPRRRVGLREIGPGTAALVGLAQGMALMPGLSRSGTTITFALFAGVKRRWAAEYSFFVAIPTILLASGVQSLEVIFAPDPGSVGLLPMVLGFAVAALVGIAALHLVLRLLYRARFRYFAYYVWLLAAAVVLATVQGWL